ncbi:MAG: DUF59 domain-containing protein [Bacteroidota bacterium]
MDKKKIEDDIIAKLKTVYDPEIPVDIYELGLIYGIVVEDNGATEVTMTLTSPSCPVAESLPGEVRAKVEEVEEVSGATVTLTFDPPWEKSMMSEEAQLELGFL